MRLCFQEKPWDLYAAFCYAASVSVALLILGQGNLLAVFSVIFLPGYVLVAAVFPGNTDIDWFERVLLAVGLGIAAVLLLGLSLALSPWGLRFSTLTITSGMFTIGVGFAAYLRRMDLPPQRRLAASVILAVPLAKDTGLPYKLLVSVLIGCVIISVSLFAIAALAPRPSERFTEFFLLGSSGNASRYPITLNVSEPGEVILDVRNRESATQTYEVQIYLIGVRRILNTSSGVNDTVDQNRSRLSSFDFTLANGDNWTIPYVFSIKYTGIWKVQFILFKSGDLPLPYREIHLYITVV